MERASCLLDRKTRPSTKGEVASHYQKQKGSQQLPLRQELQATAHQLHFTNPFSFYFCPPTSISRRGDEVTSTSTLSTIPEIRIKKLESQYIDDSPSEKDLCSCPSSLSHSGYTQPVNHLDELASKWLPKNLHLFPFHHRNKKKITKKTKTSRMGKIQRWTQKKDRN